MKGFKKMKSISSLVSEAIEGFRQKVAVWDNPNASLAEKAEVVKFVLINDSKFCQEVAKLAIKPASTKTPTKTEITKVVAEMETVAEPPAKPTTIVLESAPASKPIKPTIPAPTTVAPRTLAPPTPEQRKNKLVSILSGFVEANKKIDGEKTRRLLGGVVNSPVPISEEEATLVLRAARKANDIGFHLIDRGSSDIFYCASVEAVDRYVFGQDGEMVQVLAGLAEAEGKISDRLAARIFILLTALGYIKERGVLGEFEVSRVETLQTAVANKIGYQKIGDAIKGILKSEDELEKIHRQAQVPNHALAGIADLVN